MNSMSTARRHNSPPSLLPFIYTIHYMHHYTTHTIGSLQYSIFTTTAVFWILKVHGHQN